MLAVMYDLVRTLNKMIEKQTKALITKLTLWCGTGQRNWNDITIY